MDKEKTTKKMREEEVRQMLKENFEEEADCIMAEVNSDPSLKDVKAPDEIYDRLMRQIQENEAEQAKRQEAKEEKEEQEQEALKKNAENRVVNKSYKKKRKSIRYFIMAAVIVGVFGAGITSVGGPERIFEKFNWDLAGREQTNIDSDNARVVSSGSQSEEEAYQKIEDLFGFSHVRFNYLPDNMKFVEAIVEEETQNARLYYEQGTEKVLSCTMWFNYRTTSTGVDIEDVAIKEYETEVAGNKILVKQYAIEEGEITRWRAEFEYQKVQYFVMMSGFTEEEVDLVVKNLYFNK